MRIRAFITHKQLEEFSDCQDRFRVNPDTKSIALSDGMGQSVFQDIWADILCQYFVENPGWTASHESIIPLCTRWKEASAKFVESQKASPFGYLLRNAFNSGKSAGATFVGVRFDGDDLIYNIQGDSSLIKVSGCRIDSKDSIMTSQIGAFDSYPDYFDSNPLTPGRGDNTKNGRLHIENGDVFLVVSDPFSDFFYEKSSQGEDCHELVSEILKLETPEGFERLVNDWRDNQRMHNDDSTLIIIENDGKLDFELGYVEDIFKRINGESESQKNEEEQIESATELPCQQVSSTSEIITNSILQEKPVVSPTPQETTKLNPSDDITEKGKRSIEEIERLKGDNTKLNEDIKVARNLIAQFEESNKDRNYRQIIGAKDKEIKRAKADVDKYKNELSTLRSNYHKSESLVRKLQGEKVKLNNRIKQLEKRVSELEQPKIHWPLLSILRN